MESTDTRAQDQISGKIHKSLVKTVVIVCLAIAGIIALISFSIYAYRLYEFEQAKVEFSIKLKPTVVKPTKKKAEPTIKVEPSATPSPIFEPEPTVTLKPQSFRTGNKSLYWKSSPILPPSRLDEFMIINTKLKENESYKITYNQFDGDFQTNITIATEEMEFYMSFSTESFFGDFLELPEYKKFSSDNYGEIYRFKIGEIYIYGDDYFEGPCSYQSWNFDDDYNHSEDKKSVACGSNAIAIPYPPTGRFHIIGFPTCKIKGRDLSKVEICDQIMKTLRFDRAD